jgi:hypothetical protein
MSLHKTLIALFICAFAYFSEAQISEDYFVGRDSSLILTEKQCNKFSKRASKKCDRLAARIHKSTDSYFQKFEALEEKALMSICETDERHAESLMRGSLYSFRRMESMQERKGKEQLGTNIPEFDSLNLAAEYLIDRDNDLILNDTTVLTEKCTCEGLSTLKKSQANLRVELKRTEIIQSYVKERSHYLNGLGDEYPQIVESLQSLEKVNYYMAAQSNEYLNLFADRSRPEKLLFGALNKIPGFSEFASLNKQMPQTSALASGITGQTMDIAMAEFKSAAQNQGLDPTELLNQSFGLKNIVSKNEEVKGSIQDARKNTESLIAEINEEYKTMKSDSSLQVTQKEKMKNEIDLSAKENWEPNPLKTKRFVDRLTYGTSLQANPHTTFFPTTGTFAAQASFQVTTKMNLGLGASYMLAYSKSAIEGSEFKRMRLRSNGYAFRSFYDFNVHRNIFLQVNYEFNHRVSSTEYLNPLIRPLSIASTNGQQAFLVGLNLKTPSSKRTRKTLEMLYDFMHDKTGQPALSVRMGMEFLPKNTYKG